MKRILTITAMTMALMAGTVQAQDNRQTSDSDKAKTSMAAPAQDHNSTRSNKVTISGPDGGLSDKEKCEAEGGVWYVRPGAANGFCFKEISPSETGASAAPANDFNSSRSNRTGTISPNGPGVGNGGDKGQATDYNSSRSNKADSATSENTNNHVYDDDGNLVNKKRIGGRN